MLSEKPWETPMNCCLHSERCHAVHCRTLACGVLSLRFTNASRKLQTSISTTSCLLIPVLVKFASVHPYCLRSINLKCDDAQRDTNAPAASLEPCLQPVRVNLSCFEVLYHHGSAKFPFLYISAATSDLLFKFFFFQLSYHYPSCWTFLPTYRTYWICYFCDFSTQTPSTATTIIIPDEVIPWATDPQSEGQASERRITGTTEGPAQGGGARAYPRAAQTRKCGLCGKTAPHARRLLCYARHFMPMLFVLSEMGFLYGFSKKGGFWIVLSRLQGHNRFLFRCDSVVYSVNQ